MSKTMKNMLLLAKKQTARGTAATPTPTENAILVSALNPTPIKMGFVDRAMIVGAKGSTGKAATGVHRLFEFSVPLGCSGAAGTAPAYADLILGTGWSETVTPGTDVVYDPVSSGEPWLTLCGYLDGIRWRMVDAKGKVSWTLNAEGIPEMKMQYIGEYEVATDTPFPTTQDFSDFLTPPTVSKLNTPVFTFFGHAAVMNQLTLDDGGALVYHDHVNGGGAHNGDRNISGSTTFELPSIAAKNFEELARTGELGVLDFEHGAVAGRIFGLNAPAVQITGEPSITNKDNKAMVTVPFTCTTLNGNTNRELSMTFK